MNRPVNLKQKIESPISTLKRNIQQIEQPSPPKSSLGLKIFLYVIAIVVITFTLYSKWYKPKQVEIGRDNSWYAIELLNGEKYFGQIDAINADPIVVRNAYYDYDQGKKGIDNPADGNLRLVKRGKETHGPDGILNIVRYQVKYIEKLAENSKVLKAILDYEQ